MAKQTLTIDEYNERRNLAYDLVKAQLTRWGPMRYQDLLTEAISWGLDRGDLFRAKQALGVHTRHHKWDLTTPPA